MKKHITTIFLIVGFLAGVCLLLYPTLGNIWNSYYQSKAIVDYKNIVEDIDKNNYEKILNNANEYNKKLIQNNKMPFKLSDNELEEYNSIINVIDKGTIGYIEIPKIDIYLPIYHGTSENTLAKGIGHLEGSSFPIGGISTHSVLLGHRGLPSSKLFTNLDDLEIGDVFYINVLHEKLIYQVDKISIVLPEEVGSLYIEDGSDYVTLVTCTPYGINSHRLLVRAHRIDSLETTNYVSNDAIEYNPNDIAIILIAPIILIVIIITQLKIKKLKEGELGI